MLEPRINRRERMQRRLVPERVPGHSSKEHISMLGEYGSERRGLGEDSRIRAPPRRRVSSGPTAVVEQNSRERSVPVRPPEESVELERAALHDDRLRPAGRLVRCPSHERQRQSEGDGARRQRGRGQSSHEIAVENNRNRHFA